MVLRDKINQDLQAALKNQDTVRLGALRLLSAALKNKEIEKRAASGKDADQVLTEVETIQVISKEYKQRRESAAEYSACGREDLSKQEMQEAEILAEYLPEMLSGTELEKVVREKIAKLGITDETQLGKLMGSLSQELAGKADLGEVSQIAKRVLQKETSG